MVDKHCHLHFLCCKNIFSINFDASVSNPGCGADFENYSIHIVKSITKMWKYKNISNVLLSS